MSRGPRVVIIGAGIVGCSLADELASRGWTDVTVLDQGRLFAAGGSTSHAPGSSSRPTARRRWPSSPGTRSRSSARLELDGQWCFRQVGGLEIALTPERLVDLRRRHGWAQSWGIEGRLLDPDECAAAWPLLDRGAVLGGYLVPTDGLAKAVRASEAQARRATEAGARFLGEQTVTDIRTDGGRVTAVITDRGEFPADIVVCAAGIWGPRVGALAGVPVPLQPLAHQYVKTSPLPELAAIAAPADLEDLRPILRIQDRDLYAREHVDRLGIGGLRPPPDADRPGGRSSPRPTRR